MSHKLIYVKKIFCAKIERVFFTNSAKVGLCSTYNMGKGGRSNTRVPTHQH